MWQQDSEATSCACGTHFTIFNRKHHCRLCGQIFCGVCTTGRSSIPSFIQTTIQTSNVRLCDTCLSKCTKTKTSEPLIRTMACLPVAISDIASLALNTKWAHATKTLLLVYRKLPFKMPYERFSNLETQLLKTHLHTFGGHSVWDIQCIRALRVLPTKRSHECSALKCPGTCVPTSEIHAVELLNTFPSTQLLRLDSMRAWFRKYLNKMSNNNFILYMPHFLKRSMTPSARQFIQENIVPRCHNIRVAYAFYYECQLYNDPVYKDLTNHMLEKFPQYKKDFIYSDSLVQYIQEIVNGNRFQLRLPARLPYEPETLCTAVHDPVKLHSSTAPSVIVINTNKNSRYILVKSDDLTKDRLVMNIAKHVESLCGAKCVQYPVFPTLQGGWVEMLPKAKTLYELKYGLTSHIYNNFPDQTTRCVRRRFIRSAVGACIVSYIMGVGDRHLQNMVISNGEVAHIDFSYLLGHDPKLQMDIRITPPMVLMMGGDHSEDYSRFVKNISVAFQKLRKHTGLWYALMTYLSPGFTLADVQDHIQRKLMPGLRDAEATMRIVDIVKHNSNTWKHSVSDITHQIFQMDF